MRKDFEVNTSAFRNGCCSCVMFELPRFLCMKSKSDTEFICWFILCVLGARNRICLLLPFKRRDSTILIGRQRCFILIRVFCVTFQAL